MLRTRILIAAFATLGVAASAHAVGDVATGQAKAGGCSGCHGANGEGNGSNPPLAGTDQSGG